MPYKHTITSDAFRSQLSSTGTTDTFWAIQDNVGYGYKNHWLDVMMVQYFINKSARSKVLEPDGLFGGKTWRAIKDYQKHWNLVSDGMVSAVKGDKYFTKKQGRVYTICLLNIDYYILYPSFYEDLKMDPDLPSYLCNHFSADFPFGDE